MQDINWLPAALLQHEAFIELVVGQNACPLSPTLDLRPYDPLLLFAITLLGFWICEFRLIISIGFDDRLLHRHRVDGSRPHPLTFVGLVVS